MNDLQNNTRKLTPSEAMFRLATQYIGLQEIKGEENNPIIMQMFKDIGHSWVKDDEMSWCSTFINWIAFQVGCEMSGALDARSWLGVGKITYNPKHGDVVVFWRESIDSWKGHVGLFAGYDKFKNILVLGGNQNNEGNVSTYLSSRVLGFRELSYKNK